MSEEAPQGLQLFAKYSGDMVDTLHDSLLVLDKDLNVAAH